jgi:hypothetical protein
MRAGWPLRRSGPAPAGRLPLRGADLALIAMQSLWARPGVSNNTLLVVQCDAPIAPERIRRALDQFVPSCPWPAARLRRPFPWGKLHWAAGPPGALVPPPVRRRSVASHAELHRELEAELNSAIDPRRDPPLRFLIVDCGPEPATAQGFLVLTWFHPLMDPRGGQNLLMHLARLDPDGDHPLSGSAPPSFVPDPDPRPLRERGRLGRRSLRYMRTLTPVPPVSPGTGLSSPGRIRFRQEGFVEGHSSARDERVTREITWRLALVGKAMAGLWDRRGLPAVPFLVPISVDLRPKGDAGPTFGNWLAFHFARFSPAETADVAGLARALRAQMADAVRDGQIEANAVAMEFLHYRPLRLMRRYLPAGSSGETFSFNCADLMEFPAALARLCGRSVVNAYHVPAVLPRPGIGVFFNRCGPTNNLVVSWIDGAVSEEEVARIVEVVRDGMEWTRLE